MIDEMKKEYGEETFTDIDQDDLKAMIRDRGQRYNTYILDSILKFKKLQK
jgi:hypothetical protein